MDPWGLTKGFVVVAGSEGESESGWVAVNWYITGRAHSKSLSDAGYDVTFLVRPTELEMQVAINPLDVEGLAFAGHGGPRRGGMMQNGEGGSAQYLNPDTIKPGRGKRKLKYLILMTCSAVNNANLDSWFSVADHVWGSKEPMVIPTGMHSGRWYHAISRHLLRGKLVTPK